MPVMEGRSGDQPLQRAEAPADVRVDEEAPEHANQNDHGRQHSACLTGRLGQAQQKDQDVTAQAGEHHVERVGARVDQEVEFLGAVMDRVKAPQERHLMRPAMPPIGADLRSEKGGEQLQPHRHRRDPQMHMPRQERMNRAPEIIDGIGEDDPGRQIVQEVIGQVRHQPLADNPLLAMAEQTLGRQEDRRQHHQPERQQNDADLELRQVSAEVMDNVHGAVKCP